MFHVKQKTYDIIVVGAGHAGVEAATMASRLGCNTALVTFSSEDIGTLSCNPAMGGLGKGHLIREIDAMGGLIGRASDKSGIQFKVLNKTRGAAVHGPRAQIDRNLYKKSMRSLIDVEGIDILIDEVENICISDQVVDSLFLKNRGKVLTKAIIVTTGTFLSGKIFRGNETWPAGRLNCKPSTKLAAFFKNHFKVSRLKTGTPPRIDGSTINYSLCEVQKGDSIPEPFSFSNEIISLTQEDCFITNTNEKTHNIIKESINLSAIYNGNIKSKGPRYCPSIEDKVKRFRDKPSHQIFLEPETKDRKVIYPNGISNSLPRSVQEKFVRSIRGLENCVIKDYGYAIEYDCIDSREIDETYETKKIKGLYLAGQINGTTGYEEAAAQGLIAGINAARKLSQKRKLIIDRSQGYIGVMTSDLCKGGLVEPYRMFTSRAEYRLMLRADNADERLTDIAIELGIVNKAHKKSWLEKKEKITKLNCLLKSLKASPQVFKRAGIKINQDGRKRSAYEILSYKDVLWGDIEKIWPEIGQIKVNQSTINQIKNNAFYSKYTNRQIEEIEQLKKETKLKIGSNFNYNGCSGLSNEIKEILVKNRPRNIGEAKNLPGMTPAAASILLNYIKK